MGGIAVLVLAIIAIIALVVALDRRDKRIRGLDPHTGQWAVPQAARPTAHEVLPYVAIYALYAGLVVLSGIVFFTWSPTILALVVAFVANEDWQRTLYLFGRTLVGLILFLFVMAAEPYLRAGVQRGQLVRRSIYLLVAIGVAGGIGIIVRRLATAAIIGDGST